MDKKFEFEATEKDLTAQWKKDKIYRFKINNNKESFSIDTPPPTVSGKMHIGHAFSYSQGDIIARYKRMKGFNVYYPFGTDDNGLPTERLIEKEKKINSKKLSREEFINICNDALEEIKPPFIQDWIDIGVSCDFDKSYSTIDEDSRKIAQKTFLHLLKKSRVYIEESPISWCTHCQTGIAQAEFDNVENQSLFNDIVFKHKNTELIISTTRPELLGACVALAAHPNDKRYSHLKGKFAQVPLFSYEVPIIFDENVEIEKGTGLMMVCTFGDKDDIDKWRRHNLPLKNIITSDGHINHLAKPYDGLKIKEARKKIIEDLESEGLLINKRKITNYVNVHERCGTELEFLKTKQWFFKILDEKQSIIDKGHEIKWYPDYMKKRFDHWVENLNWDWCISRQRHFGIPIPVWYTKEGEIVLPEEDELPLDPVTSKPRKHKDKELIAEQDVFDTWFTSGLTPEISLNKTNTNFGDKYVFDLRMQAHDIIRTWTFYTICQSYFNHKIRPWNNIMISGFVLDPKGNKMSKSLGNTVSPQELLKKFGADALRYWTASSKLGDDLPYQEKDVQTGKKTVNKIANAARFVWMNLEGFNPKELSLASFVEKDLSAMDKWMLTKLNRAIKTSGLSFEEYEYSKSKQAVDNVFWHVFCDNYLEFVKYRVYNTDDETAKSVLYVSLLNMIKLYAPIMPFITEFVYKTYFEKHEKEKSIHITSWPEYVEELIDESSEKAGDLAVKTIEEVRKYKSTNKMSLKAELGKVVVEASEEELLLLSKVKEDIEKVGNISDLEFVEADEFNVIF